MSERLRFPTSLLRREFLRRGVGGAALAWMLWRDQSRASAAPHFAPRARRVIFLCQSGGPSQVDLFDPKPELTRRHGEELPESVRAGQRLTTMTADQSSKPLTASPFRFARHGESGIEVSELLPHTARVVDSLCVIRSLHTDAINHDPAMSFLQTGSEQAGRPGFGAWVSFGLARESQDLPDFLVMVSGGRAGDQPLSSRLWSAAFLPPRHQGVRLRSQGAPLLFLDDPPERPAGARPLVRDALEELNRLGPHGGEPEVEARIEEYRRAFRLQEVAPTLDDTSDEPASTWELYGEEARRPGTFAANCLRARRLAERGVPFVQLFHRGWDHHANLVPDLPVKCRETDQGSAALVEDLRRRGMLDDTLVVWAGEFGRTSFCQGAIDTEAYGRDHHPRCFTVWLAGGGFRGGHVHGRTDDFSYNIAESPLSVHDLQATLLHALGFDHTRLTYRAEGRDFRLTDQFGVVEPSLLG